MEILGVDIGGTGIKGAIVDTEKGELISERKRIETPHPATPAAVAETSIMVLRILLQILTKPGSTHPLSSCLQKQPNARHSY